MKLSLLELTQNILSSLDSDEVNSISDTTESRQVAQVIRTAYFNILTRSNLPEHEEIFQLVASGDADLPVLMYKPDNVCRIDWIKYNTVLDGDTADKYTYMPVYPVQMFLDQVNQLNTDESNVATMDIDNRLFRYRNDTAPTCCTILKDYYIVFDAYDVDQETTLQSNKTQAYGLVVPSFEMSDSFIPEIDEQQFMLLLNEAKSLAFLELKQITHEKAELESRRQWRSLARNKAVHGQSPFDQLPNFGRK